MDSIEERPRSVVMLMWTYLLVGLIVLTIGIVALSDKSVSVSDADMTFIRFFMILGSLLSLLVFALMYKGMPSAWYVASAVALIKLMYCVFLAVSVPDKAGALVIALIEAVMLGLIMTKSTREYLLG